MSTEASLQLPLQRDSIGYVISLDGLPLRVANVQEKLEAHGYERAEDDVQIDEALISRNLDGYVSIMMVFGTTTGASAIELWPEHYWRNIGDFVPHRHEYYQEGYYMIKRVQEN